jgi:hypothetical protein
MLIRSSNPFRPGAFWRVVVASVALAIVAACGGGGDSVTPPPPPPTQVQITGVAATGSPIAGAEVKLTNASGVTSTATTGADGHFSASVAEAAPYLLTVKDGAGRTWYSYARGAGVANITPLTTLALSQAGGHHALADIAAAWSSHPFTETQVLDATRVLNANLRALFSGQSLDVAEVNAFTQEFSADGTGLDAVLDGMRVSFVCDAGVCTETITRPDGTLLVTWNGQIGVDGITLDWTSQAGGGVIHVGLGTCKAPQAGTYSLVVQTTVTGIDVPIPEVCIDGLPEKPATEAEFCSGTQTQQQLPPGVSILSCSYDGTVGNIAARITTPIQIDYSVKYTFVKN